MTIEAGASGSKNPIKIMANIFISFIGAGVLGLPYAFKEAGVLEGVMIMSFVGIVSVKAMLLLIDCKYRLIQKSPQSKSMPSSNGNGPKVTMDGIESTAEEKVELMVADGTLPQGVAVEEPIKPAAPGQDLTYGDVGYHAIGKTGRVLVDVAIIISQIGFCCAYIIFISENLSDYIHGVRLVHWLFILLPPLACLTFLRQLSSLSVSSLFAQLSNLLAFVVVFWFDFRHFSQVNWDSQTETSKSVKLAASNSVPGIHPKEISLKGFPFFLAVAVYCYEGAGMILSLEASLAAEIRHKFTTYFRTVLFIVTTLYITFGVCGYLSFGPETNAIITLNLPKGAALDFAMVVKSCLCVALFFTYPVMMFPVIRIIEGKFLTNPKENICKGNMLRIGMVILTGFVILAVPNFANLMALIGATCCCLLAFILPGVFHLKIFKGSSTKCQIAFDLFLILMGIAGAVVGTMDALVRLHETHTGHRHVAESYNTTISSYDNTTLLIPTHKPAAEFVEKIFQSLRNSSKGPP